MSRLSVLLALLVAAPAAAQFGNSGNDSGKPLHPEQAAFDVSTYALDLAISPEARTIEGSLTMSARTVAPTTHIRLDLDDALTASGVVAPVCILLDGIENCGEGSDQPLTWERLPGQVRIALGRTFQPGEAILVRVDYGGSPRVAPRPPWDGGFSWEQTASGEPWVAVSCQGEGADLWWPTKDHPSDEADSMTIRLTAPEALRAISNGQHVGREVNGDGTASETWMVTTPINNYGVSFGVGPYVEVTDTYSSPLGYTMPVTFYVLPERRADAEKQLPGFLDAVGFMERTFGPYGSREDGYHVLHTPYLGMEHQSLIAYGSTFEDNAYGFDWLHFHELAHEWFANLGTAPDWRDFWVHESFANYAEALYAEDIARRETGNEALAREAYLGYIAGVRGNLRNVQPVAPREPRTTSQMYNLPDGGFNGDIYFKGSWFLHTLRFAMADDPAFFRALGTILYPQGTEAALAAGDPAADFRWVSTEDVVATFQQETAIDLRPLAEVYLRQPSLPVLHMERRGNDGYAFRWELPEGALPDGMTFDLPVPTSHGMIPMPGGAGAMGLPSSEVRVDTTVALFEMAEDEDAEAAE
ncbi:M1 family metallopeptidase [Rubricoccus marinus]|uniref:Uncharacterized protein n=1 Tax=Rubricoccus marinus TaxID=716817 RepID=A0A259TWA5_9BACT|nr:M1 family metallopeptidase [Rubricoccus marinus]OZC01970.1 hypothetical protein BSZ36_02625 [Rubricoccus marinus]